MTFYARTKNWIGQTLRLRPFLLLKKLKSKIVKYPMLSLSQLHISYMDNINASTYALEAFLC